MAAMSFDSLSTPPSPPGAAPARGPRLPEPPTGKTVVPVAYDAIFTWDYRVERPELRALYEKAKGAMWNAQTDIPWHLNVDPEAENVPDAFSPIYGTRFWDKLDKKTELPKLRRLSNSYFLSNSLHGEQGALLATAQIACSTPGADAKFYAATQTMDEARHVEVFDRYLRDKIGVTFPISPHLDSLLGEILRDSRWDMKYLGMQILVEGLALAAFSLTHQMGTEPLLKEIVHRVIQDEARHVAFGVMSLKGIYAEMSASELRDREEFVVEGSRLLRDRLLMQEVWEHMGMPVDECVELAVQSDAMKLFRSLLFSKIVPNVKRLGLLTPRVRKGFEELGVIQYETWDASA